MTKVFSAFHHAPVAGASLIVVTTVGPGNLEKTMEK
jgi:hypothetical protein